MTRISRSRLCFALAVFAGLASALSAQKAGAPAKLQDLDALAAEAMSDWKVPGVAIAIVQDGKVIYAKGYGYRDIDKKLPVTTETLFAIGSISKSFTALNFAILNDQGKADWDQPVRRYLPEFEMYDPVASEQATPRDLFSHRTGLPRHDLVWYSSDFSRANLVSRLRFLKPNKGFREAYQYNNLTIMTMGYLEGKLTGLGWEGSVRQNIFTPLGMTHSNFSVVETENNEDHATPYEWRKETVTKVPFHNIDAIGPAGSINSNADDMARYLAFQLGDGKLNGKQIVSEANLRLMHSPQTAVPDQPPQVSYPELGHFAYGLAWVVTAYRGHNLVWHNGGIDGFYALLSMLPDDHVGVVVLTNLPHGNVPDVLAYSVFDHLLGLQPIDWLGRFREREAKEKQKEDEAKKNKPSERKTGTHPSHAIADYAGDFENSGYGMIRVEIKGDSLQLSINKLGSFPLEHYHYDIFQVPEDHNSVAAGEKFQFHMNKEGDIESISAALEPALSEDIVFTRAPTKLSADILQSLTGDYLLNEATVTVSLAGEVLHLTVPGQPVYELVPIKGLSFDIKGLSGFRVEFQKDASGRITEAVFNQPNGVFRAKRK